MVIRGVLYSWKTDTPVPLNTVEGYAVTNMKNSRHLCIQKKICSYQYEWDVVVPLNPQDLLSEFLSCLKCKTTYFVWFQTL